jgi:hypothetical protein
VCAIDLGNDILDTPDNGDRLRNAGCGRELTAHSFVVTADESKLDVDAAGSGDTDRADRLVEPLGAQPAVE